MPMRRASPTTMSSTPTAASFARPRALSPPDPKLRVIYDAARGVGIRAGYADEAERINNIVTRRYAQLLDKRYDFGKLMIQQYVIPPVITRINNVQEASGQLLYFSNSSFEIVKDARLAMGPPNWREYLRCRCSPSQRRRGSRSRRPRKTKAWRDGGFDGLVCRDHRSPARLCNQLEHPQPRLRRNAAVSRSGQAGRGLSSEPPDRSVEMARVTEGGTRAHSGERTLRLVVAPKFRKRG